MLIVLLVYFSSCQQEGIEVLTELKNASNADQGIKAHDYDKFVVKFAKSLSKSLEDKSLRQLIKENALIQEDGDYDVIWKSFKEKVHFSNGKKISQIISDNIEGSTSEDSSTELETFSSEFKKFQISVPVNCEKWNVNDLHPIVAYMLSDYDDKDEYINAFDENGKKITLSMKSIPEFPVIVVNLNERCNEDGNIKTEYLRLKAASILQPPTNLIATQVLSGIHLSWTVPSDITGVVGYIVERKGPTDLNFRSISYTWDIHNTTYTDLSVSPNVTYNYRIKCDADIEPINPSYSNIAFATAPIGLSPPPSFTATHVVQGETKLNWTNNSSQYITNNRIYRYSHTPGSTYELIATLPSTSNFYFDRNVAPGRYDYMLYHVTNSDSAAKFDFVHIPYRNIQGDNSIYIKNISFTDWDLERWPAGKPEFRINVFNVNRQNLSTFNVVSNVNFDFPSVTSHCNFSNRLIFSWNQDIWYDVLSLSMVEYDEQWGPHKITISASVKTKIGANLEVGAGAALEWDITDDFENCGTIYVDFYEQPEKTYWFQNYGASITISGSPN